MKLMNRVEYRRYLLEKLEELGDNDIAVLYMLTNSMLEQRINWLRRWCINE